MNKFRCDVCSQQAVVKTTYPDGHEAQVCIQHVPVPRTGDTVPVMWDRYRKERDSMAVVEMSDFKALLERTIALVGIMEQNTAFIESLLHDFGLLEARVAMLEKEIANDNS
jgi:hypothetical protein